MLVITVPWLGIVTAAGALSNARTAGQNNALAISNARKVKPAPRLMAELAGPKRDSIVLWLTSPSLSELGAFMVQALPKLARAVLEMKLQRRQLALIFLWAF